MKLWPAGPRRLKPKQPSTDVINTRNFNSTKKRLRFCFTFGQITLIERVWRIDRHSYLRLLPQRLGVQIRGRTITLERAMTWLGAEHSFENDARGWKELFVFQIPKSAIQHVTLECAAQLEAAERLEDTKLCRSMPAKRVYSLPWSVVTITYHWFRNNWKRPQTYTSMTVEKGWGGMADRKRGTHGKTASYHHQWILARILVKSKF